MKIIQTRFFAIAMLMASCLFTPTVSQAQTDLVMTEGVVRKLDLENRKITLKHGDIKNLDMPGMTMVFRLQQGISLDALKPGDKVLFHVEKIEGAYVITDLQGLP